MSSSDRSIVDLMNANQGGFDKTMGVHIVEASDEKVVLEYDVDAQHKQPYGIVHGGMHCAAVESACSIGAGLSARTRGAAGVVGLENQTSFIRAVRSGKVTVTATPLTRGRSSQLWEAEARNDEGQLVSKGRVRLLCLQPKQDLAGKPAEWRSRNEP